LIVGRKQRRPQGERGPVALRVILRFELHFPM
jgi:hypothetical protein